jgi:hypothetical protein
MMILLGDLCTSLGLESTFRACYLFRYFGLGYLSIFLR